MMKVFDWTLDEYYEAIMNSMKADYGWYTVDMLRNKDKVTIHSIGKMVDERKEPDPNDIWAQEPLNSAEEVVAQVVHDIQQHIEWSPGSYLKHVATYKVPFKSQELGGWMLEDYRFDKYEGGVFFTSVTAGDRCTGSGRTFYIPPGIIDGHTYEEFLEAYFGEIADPRYFGLGVDELIGDESLKAFMGFM